MLVDWTSARIEFPANMGFRTGTYLQIDPDGEVTRAGPAGFQVEEPSWSESLRLFAPDPSRLAFSGNAVKWFQGHNAFGSADARGLVWDCLQDVRMRQLAATVGVPGLDTCEAATGVKWTRLDITRSARHPGGNDGARAWVRAAGAQAHSSHRGGVVSREGTLYFGQRSRRWGFKVYLKSDEMRRLPTWMTGRGMGSSADWKRYEAYRMAQAWAEGVLRFELVLRSLEIAGQGIEAPRTAVEAIRIWERYYGRVSIAEDVTMAEELDGLKTGERAALALWRSGGEHPKAIYPRPTFYRYRRAILEAGGPDIASPGPDQGDNLEAAGGELQWDPEVPEGAAYEPSGQRPLVLQ